MCECFNVCACVYACVCMRAHFVYVYVCVCMFVHLCKCVYLWIPYISAVYEVVTLHCNLPLPDNVAACSLLLSHGADPNSKDSEGMTGGCLEVHSFCTALINGISYASSRLVDIT